MVQIIRRASCVLLQDLICIHLDLLDQQKLQEQTIKDRKFERIVPT
jgi:hypothetical protein